QTQSKQVGHSGAPLLRLARHELGELALRQQDRPGERRVVQSDQLLDELIDLAYAVGALTVRTPIALQTLFEQNLRRTSSGRCGACDAVLAAANFEVQRHCQAR